jgi:hypothetical protein
MSPTLIVWLVSLASVFLVGWAAGRASKRTVVVNFPKPRPIPAIKPTQAEVADGMPEDWIDADWTYYT